MPSDKREIKISPNMFITPPYITCPKCGQKSFGVLMVCEEHYLRRCKECFFPKGNERGWSSPLPKLNKKIIYIDQFAISNMMKALNPKEEYRKKNSNESFWLKLFERLDSLCKQQLIICPHSRMHIDESLLSKFYEPLKAMYKLLGYGISFYDFGTIKRFQVVQNARRVLLNEKNKKSEWDPEFVIHGRINSWQEKYYITMNTQYEESHIEELRKFRAKVNDAMRAISVRWQGEGKRKFNDWYKEELRGISEGMLEVFAQHLVKATRIIAGIDPLDINQLIPSSPVLIIQEIRDIFIKKGFSEQEAFKNVREYLFSENIADIPWIRISALMNAGIARKFACGGRKEPINCGMMYDVEVISTLMPYCDAMFIDNEARGYLTEQPLCKDINYGTHMFSLNNQAEFLAYLDGIEKSASKEHLAKVSEVYGDDWKTPYLTLYH